MPETLTPRELLDRLVAFPTVSRDSNLDLVEFVAGYLRSWGIEPSIMPNEDGTKAALYASVGPDGPGGVVLSGHTDVVPVDGQDWTRDPFTVAEEGGRLYGRGTCDMKGFDALALAALPLALERGVKRPLQIALSYDEEIGCTGAPPLIDHMQASGLPRPEMVIVGEPSNMKVVTGHKGGFGFDVHVRGFEVHSSLIDRGVSAIHSGAELIHWVNETNAAAAATPPGPVAAQFDPPWTSLHVGRIEGGTAHNITAKDCRFAMTLRIIPGESTAEWEARARAEMARIEAGMQAVRPETGIDAPVMFDVPGLAPEEDGAAERLTRGLTGDNSRNVVSYGTEAGHFQARGYSVVVCGPGDIAQAHQPDEFLAVEQFEAGWAFMERLVDWLGR